MSGWEHNENLWPEPVPETCATTQSRFSAYLDGALDGGSMAELATHLHACGRCDAEFHAWRSLQTALGELGHVQPPAALQAQLRDTLAGEFNRGTFRSPARRLAHLWERTLAPAALRLSAGLAAALVLIGSAVWVIGSAVPVQANDDRLADFHAPRYLYSQVPSEPITTTSGFVAVLVDAKVDAQGRVYDYRVVEGPDDRITRNRIEANLLGSVFQPATVFGVPVPAHTMITYTAFSVRG